MKYVAPIVLAVVGLIVGAAVTFSAFFAIVWGLQLPTRVTVYVQIVLAIVQIVTLYLALRSGRLLAQRAGPVDGLVCGLATGIFGVATHFQIMSLS